MINKLKTNNYGLRKETQRGGGDKEGDDRLF